MSRKKVYKVKNNIPAIVTEDSEESWIHKRWRPMMAWSYMILCIFDFLIAPILWSIFQAGFGGSVQKAWNPLTLQGAGLFHLAMGAILGVTAWGRTQEKMAWGSMGFNNMPPNMVMGEMNREEDVQTPIRYNKPASRPEIKSPPPPPNN